MIKNYKKSYLKKIDTRTILSFNNNCARGYILLEDKDFQATTQIDCILIGRFTEPKMTA